MDSLIELKWRANVRKQVTTCKGCNLVNVATHPVPFSGISLPKVACVGEAPGRQEDVEGRPFVGASGQLLRKWLNNAGFQEQEVSFVNVVSCWPNRTPTGKEVAACRTNLAAQLMYLRPKYLFVLGGVALNAILNPGIMRIGDGRGKWFRAEGYGLSPAPFSIATWHPAAVLRNRILEFKAVEDVEYLRLVTKEDEDPLLYMGNVRCWSPGCENSIDGDYKGLLCCKDHPVRLEGEKNVRKANPQRSVAGSVNPTKEPKAGTVTQSGLF